MVVDVLIKDIETEIMDQERGPLVIEALQAVLSFQEYSEIKHGKEDIEALAEEFQIDDEIPEENLELFLRGLQSKILC